VTAPALSGQCVIKANAPGVALIGDSHAAALGGAIRSAATAKGLGFFQATKASCPALAGVTRLMPNHPGHDKDCAAFNARTLQQIADDPSIQLVIVAGYWSAPFIEEESGSRFAQSAGGSASITHVDSRQNLRDGLLALVRKLRDAGKHVIVVQDVPVFSFDPMRHVANTTIPVRTVIGRMLAANHEIGGDAAPGRMVINRPDEAATIVAEVANSVDGVQVLDTPAEFCSTDLCRFADGETLWYADAQHLTGSGAAHAVGRIAFPESKVDRLRF
jgi:hypothetical protein